MSVGMFDHIGIVVTDLQHASEFYARVLAPLGITAIESHPRANGEGYVVMSTGAARAPFFVISAGRPSYWGDEHRASTSPMHLSFNAPSKDAVIEFHSIGLELGAKDNGAPGVRRAPFYCAFLIDPDGNNIEAGVYLDDR